jgi:RNA polymerase sigma factor (sigma-70 family)
MKNEESCRLRARAGADTDSMESLDTFLREAMERLHPESYGWAMACCLHDAEEAADTLQTAYLKVLQSKAHFEGKGEFKPWLFRVIRRTASERRRQQWRQRLVLLRFAESSFFQGLPGNEPVIPSEEAELHERAEQFRSLLNRLPARQREVLHLVYYQQLSVSQAAEVMGISTGSASQHFDRAKKRLAQYWGLNSKSSRREQTHQQQPTTHGR